MYADFTFSYARRWIGWGSFFLDSLNLQEGMYLECGLRGRNLRKILRKINLFVGAGLVQWDYLRPLSNMSWAIVRPASVRFRPNWTPCMDRAKNFFTLLFPQNFKTLNPTFGPWRNSIETSNWVFSPAPILARSPPSPSSPFPPISPPSPFSSRGRDPSCWSTTWDPGIFSKRSTFSRESESTGSLSDQWTTKRTSLWISWSSCLERGRWRHFDCEWMGRWVLRWSLFGSCRGSITGFSMPASWRLDFGFRFDVIIVLG